MSLLIILVLWVVLRELILASDDGFDPNADDMDSDSDSDCCRS